MGVDLKQYLNNAKEHNMCSEYVEKWRKCKSDKQIIDMALSAKAMDFICDSIAKGWGIDPDVINTRFAGFINGRYRSHQDGYTSEMYCQYKGDITVRTTALLIIDCEATITVPKERICEIYVCGNSIVNVIGDGRCVVVKYGVDSKNISIDCNSYKVIDKKERD